MPDQMKNLLIGLFILAGAGLLVFTMLFLHPHVGDSDQILHVRFANIDKVNVGTRVTFAGRPVGEVTAIREVTGPRNELVHTGQVYIYELTLAIDSGIDVYSSDEISLRTSGLLGERSVAITPKQPRRGQPIKKVSSDDTLYASEGGSLEETFAGFDDFAQRAEVVFDAILEQLDEMKKHQVIAHIGKTAKNLADITTALNEPETWKITLQNVKEFSDRLNELGERISVSWDDVDDMLANLVTASEDATEITEDIKGVTDKISKGQGTIGKIVDRDDLYLRLTGLLSKANTLLDDVNHYGILFHLNKGWQRMRARRANLMQKLCSPQQFRNFFEDEINQISTSLARVSSVLQTTQCSCPPSMLMCDNCFRRVFADFLERVEALEENLQLYNTELNDRRDCMECRDPACCCEE